MTTSPTLPQNLFCPPVDRPTLRDPQHQAQFDQRGYVVVPLLDAEQVAQLQSGYERLESRLADGFYSSLWSQDAGYRAGVNALIAAALADSAARYLANYRLVLGNFAVKQAVPASVVPLHQDWSFVDETRFASVTIWSPLIDTNHQVGCLAVVPGSHRFCDNLRPNGQGDAACSPYAPLAQEIVEHHLLELPLRAGEGVIYHSRLLHYSGPNRGAVPRVAVVGVGIPQEAQLRHYYRVSPREVETYAVAEDFYWREAQLGERPRACPCLEIASTPQTPFTSEQLAQRLAQYQRERSATAARPGTSQQAP